MGGAGFNHSGPVIFEDLTWSGNIRSWPVAPFHGIGIVGYRMTDLRQRPEFVFDESLINPFDPKANLVAHWQESL